MEKRVFPTVISHYTENTPYEREAKKLRESCEKWNIKCMIEPTPHQGSWEKNCALKPRYIREKLAQLQRAVLWLDADAMVYQKPPLFETLRADIALHSNSSLPQDHPSKVNSGTLLFFPTPSAFSLLEKWEKETSRLLLQDGKAWDQISLRNVLWQEETNIYLLDSRYCRIFTKIQTEKELKESFFIHFQASRTLKKILNKEVVPFWDEGAYSAKKRKDLLNE